MKKNYIFTLLILCFSLSSFGQGAEAFTNSGATSSYLDGSFVGADDITWSYIHSRNANNDANGSGISLPALMLRRASSDSKITSSTISNGIGDFSVKLYKGFTGSGNRQVELFINGESKGTSTTFDDFEEHIFTISGINVSGDIIIEIKNSTDKQVIIDDITWTSYSDSSTPALTITAPTDGATIDATASLDVALSVTNFTVGERNAAGVDGHIHWSIKENTSAAVDQSMKYNTAAETISVTAGNSYTIFMELKDNDHQALSPEVNTTITFTVSATASVNDVILETLKMYPNPAIDVLNISSQNTINSVEILNVLGQKVMRMNIGDTNAEINISNLNTGIYLIKYETNNIVNTKKFVKN